MLKYNVIHNVRANIGRAWVPTIGRGEGGGGCCWGLRTPVWPMFRRTLAAGIRNPTATHPPSFGESEQCMLYLSGTVASSSVPSEW